MFKYLIIFLLLLIPSIYADPIIEDGSMFEIELNTPNILMFILLILVSGYLISTKLLGAIISGGLILVFISIMIMYSFNIYIGLMLLLATTVVLFESFNK